MEFLKVQKYGVIAIVEVCRPEALNALNEAVLLELRTLLDEYEHDGSTRALILTGFGDKAFIAGADIKAMSKMDEEKAIEFCALGQEVALALERAPFVTIAAVNGFALGGGLEMALACDYIFAAQGARLGLPEVTLGIIPGFGGTQRLARAVGTRLAKELILTGRVITADEAHLYGIVSRVCTGPSLINDCIASAETVVRNSALAVAQAKKSIDLGFEMPLEVGLDLERKCFGECFNSPGRVAGFEAFIKKYDNREKLL